MSALISRLRMHYKPKKIKVLFLAESPPAPIAGEERFFYNARLEQRDFLYKAIMKTFFPKFRYQHGEKNTGLRKFQQHGGYLIDATNRPVNRLPNENDRNRILRSERKKTLLIIKKLVSQKTPIVLIKKNIFSLFNCSLRRAGYNVIHESGLPFPSHGNQNLFIDLAHKCLRNDRAWQSTIPAKGRPWL